ncbi:hypothetical protein BC629DRAFT_1442747 [Irpex lacteus]|nr:hypothetical protein BC629DRAFT_1442747 [Irpex lacteus]
MPDVGLFNKQASMLRRTLKMVPWSRAEGVKPLAVYSRKSMNHVCVYMSDLITCFKLGQIQQEVERNEEAMLSWWRDDTIKLEEVIVIPFSKDPFGDDNERRLAVRTACVLHNLVHTSLDDMVGYICVHPNSKLGRGGWRSESVSGEKAGKVILRAKYTWSDEQMIMSGSTSAKRGLRSPLKTTDTRAGRLSVGKGHIAEDGSRTERSLVDMLTSPFQTEEYFEAENNCNNEDNLQAASCNATGELTIHLRSIEAYLDESGRKYLTYAVMPIKYVHVHIKASHAKTATAATHHASTTSCERTSALSQRKIEMDTDHEHTHNWTHIRRQGTTSAGSLSKEEAENQKNRALIFGSMFLGLQLATYRVK